MCPAWQAGSVRKRKSAFFFYVRCEFSLCGLHRAGRGVKLERSATSGLRVPLFFAASPQDRDAHKIDS